MNTFYIFIYYELFFTSSLFDIFFIASVTFHTLTVHFYLTSLGQLDNSVPYELIYISIGQLYNSVPYDLIYMSTFKHDLILWDHYLGRWLESYPHAADITILGKSKGKKETYMSLIYYQGKWPQRSKELNLHGLNDPYINNNSVEFQKNYSLI